MAKIDVVLKATERRISDISESIERTESQIRCTSHTAKEIDYVSLELDLSALKRLNSVLHTYLDELKEIQSYLNSGFEIRFVTKVKYQEYTEASDFHTIEMYGTFSEVSKLEKSPYDDVYVGWLTPVSEFKLQDFRDP